MQETHARPVDLTTPHTDADCRLVLSGVSVHSPLTVHCVQMTVCVSKRKVLRLFTKSQTVSAEDFPYLLPLISLLRPHLRNCYVVAARLSDTGFKLESSCFHSLA